MTLYIAFGLLLAGSAIGGFFGWRIGRWQTDGDAAAARLEASNAVGARQKAEKERDDAQAGSTALREQFELVERARKQAVDEASDLRRRLAAAAVKGSAADAFDRKFGGPK